MASGYLTPPVVQTFGHGGDVCEDGTATPKDTAGILYELGPGSKLTHLLGEKLQRELDGMEGQEAKPAAFPMRPPGNFTDFLPRDKHEDNGTSLPVRLTGTFTDFLPTPCRKEESPALPLPIRHSGTFFDLDAEHAREAKAQDLPYAFMDVHEKAQSGEFMKVQIPDLSFEHPPPPADEVQSVAPPKVVVAPPKVPPPRQQTRADAAQPTVQVISRGSVGHPITCATACKYVKRKGGCREGVECPNCHECFWSKDGKKGDLACEGSCDASAKTRQNVAQVVQAPTLSLGTIGHPYNCGKPCKYVRRKGGCMHGSKCVKCHQCQWRRDRVDGTVITDGSCDVVGFSEFDRAHTDRTTLILDELVVEEPEVISMPVLSTQPEALLMPAGAPGLEPEILVMPCLEPTSMEPPESMQPLSVGSIGHPQTCGPPCKYAMKARGCKDGKLCTHCHECKWTRYGPKAVSL
eukprot:TRINITY_DN8142_c0_g1_i1.p1 TRINITY_DN8142_c0_g1~~TRINITY_DN8142_c0_g1_i1.p1  ORF type:complete len:463 (+),score=81.35 TRINITY_DN8142_c0_g1_i1:87-1475(+)